MTVDHARVRDIEVLVVEPGSMEGEAKAPPSKSYTHRALLAGLIASGRSIIWNPLESSDTLASVELVKALGAHVEWGIEVARILSEGPKWGQPSVNCRESGTTLRLGVGVASLLDKPFILYGEGRLNKRPIKPLLDSLANLGASFLDAGGYPPVAVKGPIRPGTTKLDASDSSQFLSALLMAASGVEGGVEVRVEGLSSKGYVDATVEVLEAYGARIEREGYDWFRVEGPLRASTYYTPGDWSSAAVLLAVAAGTEGRIKVFGLRYPDPQPDSRIVGILRDYGARITIGGGWVEVEGGRLASVEVDVDESPDLAPVIAALGAVACGNTRICGISRLRIKESDRVSTILGILRDASVEAGLDGECIIIRGRCGRLEGGYTLDARGDHRIAMAAALLALASKRGGLVRGWRSVDKSYPAFWRDLERLGARLHVQGQDSNSS
ncbi:MAG: 3-phosphoshikimate 1-carboxyvinyltransferase [Desulfurococcales archaeon]|nr:3-phosphoshikimate 1-carboxyvinyltransferase [Desulfurococcales archaeon]MCE4605369.1 3-phosphoshikimate 1-carboxyvinyltransferase [Desulfurococcales archaeon]